MLNRRDFLKALGLSALGVAAPVILEPARKMWFVPSSAPVGSRVERLTAERTFAGLVPRDGETWSNVAGPPVAPSRARPREADEPLWCQQIDGSGYAIDSLDEAPVGTTAYVEPLDLDIQQAMRAQWQRAYDAYKRQKERDAMYAGLRGGGKSALMRAEYERAVMQQMYDAQTAEMKLEMDRTIRQLRESGRSGLIRSAQRWEPGTHVGPLYTIIEDCGTG